MSFQLSNESAPVMHVDAVVAHSASAAKSSEGIPRWADAGIAAIGLVVAAPVIAISALAIAVSSAGPIVFRQKRVGQHGRLFDLYKLRTMKPSTDGPEVTAKNDTRITPVGRFLRRTKLESCRRFGCCVAI